MECAVAQEYNLLDKQEFQLSERGINSARTVNPINAYLHTAQGFPEFLQAEVHHNKY